MDEKKLRGISEMLLEEVKQGPENILSVTLHVKRNGVVRLQKTTVQYLMPESGR